MYLVMEMGSFFVFANFFSSFHFAWRASLRQRSSTFSLDLDLIALRLSLLDIRILASLMRLSIHKSKSLNIAENVAFQYPRLVDGKNTRRLIFSRLSFDPSEPTIGHLEVRSKFFGEFHFVHLKWWFSFNKGTIWQDRRMRNVATLLKADFSAVIVYTLLLGSKQKDRKKNTQKGIPIDYGLWYPLNCQ